MEALYHARYCTGGYVGDEGLAVNLCEFADEASAAAGLAYATSVFQSMTNRKVFLRKATTLTVIEQRTDPATLALEKKLTAAYSNL